MGILLTVLAIIVGIVVLFLLIAAFTKRDFVLEKQIVINRPKREVFDYIKLIRNQEKYSVWVMKDPNIKLVYTGVDGTVGFTSAWQSDDKNVGVGEQEIKQINDAESMEVEIRFKKPFEGTNRARTSLTAVTDTQTRVTQVFSGRSDFPKNIMNLMMDKLVGSAMQQNLQNLKNILEQN